MASKAERALEEFEFSDKLATKVLWATTAPIIALVLRFGFAGFEVHLAAKLLLTLGVLSLGYATIAFLFFWLLCSAAAAEIYQERRRLQSDSELDDDVVAAVINKHLSHKKLASAQRRGPVFVVIGYACLSLAWLTAVWI